MQDKPGDDEALQDPIDTAAQALDAQEASTPEPQPKPQAEVPATKVKTGRGVAWFSLLFALAAAAGAGYLYYELVWQDPIGKAREQVLRTQAQSTDSASNTLSALQSDFAQFKSAQNSTLENLVTTQSEALAEAEEGIIETLNAVAKEAPPSQTEWKLAEVEYLLRIANHRVLMEEDAESAVQLLGAADAILKELGDFGMHEVRARLADEILSLKKVPVDDTQGLFLRMEALKTQLDELPLKVPEYLTKAERPVVDPELSLAERLSVRMSNYIQFRTLETKVKPLLTPDEAVYLELNLRLMLERAQLAALRRDQVVYEQSLSTAADWLLDYLDNNDPTVKTLVGEIDALIDVPLSRELPDISGSLRSFLATERSAS